jgi:hypothetical protein
MITIDGNWKRTETTWVVRIAETIDDDELFYMPDERWHPSIDRAEMFDTYDAAQQVAAGYQRFGIKATVQPIDWD